MPTRPASNASKASIAVIGGGVIGLGVAWRSAQRGASVQVFDRGAAGAGASHAAAGMLAACAEAEPGEEALTALGRESQARWPAFAAELEQVAGMEVGLRAEGTLVLALTADDQARLNHQLVFQQQLGEARSDTIDVDDRQHAGLSGVRRGPRGRVDVVCIDHEHSSRRDHVAWNVSGRQGQRGVALPQNRAIA